MSKLVELAPIRRIFEQSDFSINSFAEVVGVSPNRMARLMGRSPESTSKTLKSGEVKKYKAYSKKTSYDMAVKMADALGMDPHEAGV